MFPITVTIHTPDQLAAVLAALRPGVEPPVPAPELESRPEAAPEQPAKKRGRPKKAEAATDPAPEPKPEPAGEADSDLPAATTHPAADPTTVEEYRRKLMAIVGKVGPTPVLALIHKRAPELVKVPPTELPALLAEAQGLVS